MFLTTLYCSLIRVFCLSLAAERGDHCPWNGSLHGGVSGCYVPPEVHPSHLQVSVPVVDDLYPDGELSFPEDLRVTVGPYSFFWGNWI